MGQLRAVHIEFHGQAFSFTEADLVCLLRRWRALRELCLVYDLTTSNDIPGIADIHRLLGEFSDIRMLHIPGLAFRDAPPTPSSMLAPDARPNCNLAYLSSSTLVTDIPFSPSAIARALLAMFPGIHGAGPVVDRERLWLEIANNIEMLLDLTFEVPSPLFPTLALAQTRQIHAGIAHMSAKKVQDRLCEGGGAAALTGRIQLEKQSLKLEY
ncbi:hypothetical protein C2E23DRAFT_858536 [Lenzites betulinus]|nr:hypothetical protein C2E23DRAFT_858536 [Lenzites betulinus]